MKLINRIIKLEGELVPNCDVLMVIVQETDSSQEAAVKRVMAEKNINKFPEHGLKFVFDAFGKPAHD